MKTAAPSDKLSTEQISRAMRVRYPLADGYAMIEEVGNGTGHRCDRHADAVVMNLWPSRGLEVSGFEYKASRTDWLKELKSPGKADPIFKYCDRWWLVVGDAEIVKPGELPKIWGLLVPAVVGGKTVLKAQVEAPPLGPEELSRPFVAAMLRAAAKADVSQKALKGAKAEGHREGLEQGRANARHEAGTDAMVLDRLQKQVREFEEASGLRIGEYGGGEKLGAMVKVAHQLLKNGSWHSLEALLLRVDHSTKELHAVTKQIREDVRKHLHETIQPGLLEALENPHA